MTFDRARILFDAMDEDHKGRVVHIFDHICASPYFPNIHNAFIEAVADESSAMAIEAALFQVGATC